MHWSDWHPLLGAKPCFGVTMPTLDELNSEAGRRGLHTGGGFPLKFVAPDEHDVGYERRAFDAGEITTRPDNWHDAFNALIWFRFPLTKAAMNRAHVAALEASGQAGARERGPARDALTQFDECGVIVAGTEPGLWEGLRAHHWREVFVSRRDELLATTRFVLFGHASHDALRAAFIGLCGKALFIETDIAGLRNIDRGELQSLDEALACRLASVDFSATRQRWQPLPLLGIPGVTPANEAPAYYDDTRQFRPPRTMPAGSSPGSR